MPLLITGAVLVCLAILLSFRVRLVFTYAEVIEVKVRWLFITVRMNGREKGKPKKRKERNRAQPPEEPKPKRGVSDFLNLFQQYSEVLKELAQKVLRKISIDRIALRLWINEEDAAKTALLYGEACAVIYPVLTWLNGRFPVRSHEIDIRPVFSGSEKKIEFECVLAGMRLGGLIVFGIHAAAVFLSAAVKRRKLLNKPVKDGVS